MTTQILLATESKDDIKETGIFFSKLWNVVDSLEWANLKPEEGDGGAGPYRIEHLKTIAKLGGYAKGAKKIYLLGIKEKLDIVARRLVRK